MIEIQGVQPQKSHVRFPWPGYVEVSCKTRHNIRKLANFIYDSVFDLRSQQGSSKLLLEERIPATYLALEDVIANIAKGRGNTIEFF